MNKDPFLRDMCGQAEALADVYAKYRSGEGRALLAEAAEIINKSPNLLVTGMGASFFAGHAARGVFHEYGFAVAVEDTSLLLDNQVHVLGPETTLLIVSQSGESAEAIRLLDSVAASVRTIALTNNQDSTVGRGCHLVLPLGVIGDHSVAIKTYTASILALILVAAHLGQAGTGRFYKLIESTINRFDQALERSSALLHRIPPLIEKSHSVYLMGRGGSYGSALEGALLFKEGAKRSAEGFSAGQFRHGSVEVIEPGVLCFVFNPKGKFAELNTRFIAELRTYGADVVAIGEPFAGDGLVLPVPFLHEYLAPLLEIIPIQALVRESALRSGIEPGSFRNTKPVITSE